MRSAKETLILANIWMSDFYTPHVFETSNEWIENLSSEDLIVLIGFLDEHIGYDVDNPSQIHYGYTEWRTNTWSHWENVNNCYMNLDSIGSAKSESKVADKDQNNLSALDKF